MGLAKDPARDGGRARVIDKGKTGDILYASNFGENYFDGWRPAHFSGFQVTPPCGLTGYPTQGGKLALQLSTEMRTYNALNQGVTCATFRGISRYGVRRYLSYSAFLALGVGGFADCWESFGLYIDCQKQDDSSRSFPQLQIIAQSKTDGWQKARIMNDGQASHTDIPGSQHCWPGDNDDKQNFGYMRVTWDLQANGGLGGYVEGQIQNTVYDLHSLGGGSASEIPQTDVSTGNSSTGQFSGGLNIGLFVSRSTSTDPTIAARYPVTLVADSIVLSTHD